MVAARCLADRGRPAPHSLSLVFDDVPSSDERRYIEAVLARGGFEPHLVRGDRLSPLGGSSALLSAMGEACYGANLYLNDALAHTAQQAGVRVLLDGTDGDSVVGYGFERLTELARAGRFLELRRELRTVAARTDHDPSELWSTWVRQPFSAAVRRRLRRIGLRRGKRAAGASASASPGGAPLPDWIAPEFARRIGLQDALAELRARNPAPRTSREFQIQTLSGGLFQSTFEWMDRIHAARGVEPRYPFFDRRLVEFCLDLPARLRLREGWTRFVLRSAVPELPDEVRWRGWKTNLEGNFIERFVAVDQGRVEAVLSRPDARFPAFVDRKTILGRLERWRTSPEPAHGLELCTVFLFEHWLREIGVTAWE